MAAPGDRFRPGRSQNPRPRAESPTAVMRVCLAAVAAALVLAPSATIASPSPSPTLDSVLAAPPTPAYVDIVLFVKGNDYFMIGILSRADDLADSASAQTRMQYELAPASTIPPAQWPENATSAINRSASLPVGLAVDILILAFVAGI